MKTLLTTINRFRAWRLNRWVDQLLRDALEYPRHESAALRRKAIDLRTEVARLRVAGL
ncbi:MAG: hypothetical protein MZW92_32010 [Comamonadaceae bacterium]|nr:hypothetical protein [Comamonadaceae bacterium]